MVLDKLLELPAFLPGNEPEAIVYGSRIFLRDKATETEPDESAGVKVYREGLPWYALGAEPLELGPEADGIGKSWAKGLVDELGAVLEHLQGGELLERLKSLARDFDSSRREGPLDVEGIAAMFHANLLANAEFMHQVTDPSGAAQLAFEHASAFEAESKRRKLAAIAEGFEEAKPQAVINGAVRFLSTSTPTGRELVEAAVGKDPFSPDDFQVRRWDEDLTVIHHGSTVDLAEGNCFVVWAASPTAF